MRRYEELDGVGILCISLFRTCPAALTRPLTLFSAAAEASQLCGADILFTLSSVPVSRRGESAPNQPWRYPECNPQMHARPWMKIGIGRGERAPVAGNCKRRSTDDGYPRESAELFLSQRTVMRQIKIIRLLLKKRHKQIPVTRLHNKAVERKQVLNPRS